MSVRSIGSVPPVTGLAFAFGTRDLRDWKKDPVGCGLAEMLVAKVPDDPDDLDVEYPWPAERHAATDRAGLPEGSSGKRFVDNGDPRRARTVFAR